MRTRKWPRETAVKRPSSDSCCSSVTLAAASAICASDRTASRARDRCTKIGSRCLVRGPLAGGVDGSSAVTRCMTLGSSGGRRPLCRKASSIRGGRHTVDTRRPMSALIVAFERPGAMRPSSSATATSGAFFCSDWCSLYSLRHVSRRVSMRIDDLLISRND